MSFCSELLPHVFADQNRSLCFISDMIQFFKCYNVHFEFCQVNDGLDSQNIVFIVGQSLSGLQHSSSPEVHVSQKTDISLALACQISLRNACQSQILIFSKKSSFSVLARNTEVNKNLKLKIPKESNKFRHLVVKKRELICLGLWSGIQTGD